MTTNEPDFENYIAIDIEHNGNPKHENDQILDIAAVEVHDGTVVSEYYQMTKLDCEFNDIMGSIIGLCEENYTSPLLQSEETILKEFRNILGSDNIVAHGIESDTGELDRRLEHYNIEKLHSKCSDTNKIYSDMFDKEYHDTSKLAYVAQELGCNDLVSHNHSALYDARMHAIIYEKMLHNRDLNYDMLPEIIPHG